MATKTTTGTGGNFSTGSTWVGGVAPSAGDDIIVAAGAVLTLDADFNAASVVMQAGSTFDQAVAGTYYVDVNLAFTIGANCTVNKLTINSLTAGTGYVELTAASAASTTFTNCHVQVITYLAVNAANAINLDGTTLDQLTCATPNDSTITSGTVTILDDGNMVASGGLSLVGVNVGNLTCTKGLLTVTATASCYFSGVTLEKMTLNATDCSFAAATCTGNSSVLGTFTNCTCDYFGLTVNSEIGDSTLDFTDCTFSNSSFQGNSATSQLILSLHGTGNLLNGITISSYAVLIVNDPLPDLSWGGVSVYTNGYVQGYILASSISWATGPIIGSGGSVITVKYPGVTLDAPLLYGGNWYLYDNLSFSNVPVYNASTYFNLMSKTVQFTNGGEVVQYGGLAGPPSPAYRGVI